MNFSDSKLALSLLESQSSDHFTSINRFLDHRAAIKLFRSSRQLYSIPLTLPIFLNYFNENERNFNFDLSRLDSHSIHQNFRFFLSSLRIEGEQNFLNGKRFIQI